jgi:hypothetical protein
VRLDEFAVRVGEPNLPFENGAFGCYFSFLVPTVPVEMPSSTLRVVPRGSPRDAERPGRHSHAERGHECGWAWMTLLTPKSPFESGAFGCYFSSFAPAQRIWVERW